MGEKERAIKKKKLSVKNLSYRLTYSGLDPYPLVSTIVLIILY